MTKCDGSYWCPTDVHVHGCFRDTSAHRSDPIEELTEALRFTVEYVGNDVLPPIPGWSWYDALRKYAPEKAQAFADNPVILRPREAS